MAGKAASLCNAWERCCPLVVGLRLSLPLSMSSMARSLSVAGSSTAAFTVRACKPRLLLSNDTVVVLLNS